MSSTKIKVRRGTSLRWASVNPVLKDGELGFEKDTLKLKIGDGTTAWNSLPYITSSGGSSFIGDVKADRGYLNGRIDSIELKTHQQQIKAVGGIHPTPLYWSGASFHTHFSGLTTSPITATGTFNGEVIQNIRLVGSDILIKTAISTYTITNIDYYNYLGSFTASGFSIWNNVFTHWKGEEFRDLLASIGGSLWYINLLEPDGWSNTYEDVISNSLQGKSCNAYMIDLNKVIIYNNDLTETEIDLLGYYESFSSEYIYPKNEAGSVDILNHKFQEDLTGPNIFRVTNQKDSGRIPVPQGQATAERVRWLL